jgi:hypothetical protein
MLDMRLPSRRISRFRSRLIKFGNLYRSSLLLSAYVGMVLASPLGDSHRFIGEVLAFVTLLILLAGASYMVSRTIARTARKTGRQIDLELDTPSTATDIMSLSAPLFSP